MLSALQGGYRLIDTANAYMNEKAVGRAIKKSGVAREEIFLETKLWPSFYEQEDVVEKTLERLDTKTSVFFSYYHPNMVEWFVKMVEERKKHTTAARKRKTGLDEMNASVRICTEVFFWMGTLA